MVKISGIKKRWWKSRNFVDWPVKISENVFQKNPRWAEERTRFRVRHFHPSLKSFASSACPRFNLH
jgi:hypothetical protein